MGNLRISLFGHAVEIYIFLPVLTPFSQTKSLELHTVETL